ncbi:MAG: type II toxin-antitoxin system prevent-host-death family antitoxin [Tatlockia sp.]|jgi:prevent-host-death family protein
MHQVNIHEAKTQLSKLIEEAVQGEPFIIAKAGKPLVKVVSIAASERKNPTRLGFMLGQLSIPDDFDQMGSEEINHLFGGDK